MKMPNELRDNLLQYMTESNKSFNEVISEIESIKIEAHEQNKLESSENIEMTLSKTIQHNIFVYVLEQIRRKTLEEYPNPTIIENYKHLEDITACINLEVEIITSRLYRYLKKHVEQ